MVSDAFALIAVVGALFVCLHAPWVGHNLKVMDHPDHARKRHAEATPLVGGIAILVPLLLWLGGNWLGGNWLGGNLLSMPTVDPRLRDALLLCAAGVGVTGFADDQAQTSPLSRMLALMVFVGVALVVDPELIAAGMNWGSFEPSPLPAWGFCALMVLSAMGVVNAVNMADGQDGLVPSMFLIWSACLVLVGSRDVTAVAEIVFFLSLIVLAFNARGKLFLGDCGSYGVTFVLGLLTMLTHAQGRISVETITVWFFIPVMDCLRLLIARVVQGRAPSAGDTDHFHHRLEQRLGKQSGLFAYIGTVAVSCVIASIAPRLSLVCIVVLTAIYCSFASLAGSSAAQTAQAGDASQPMGEGRRMGDGSGKVVAIAGREQRHEQEPA